MKLIQCAIAFSILYSASSFGGYPGSTSGDMHYQASGNDSYLVSILGVKAQSEAPIIDELGRMKFDATSHITPYIDGFMGLINARTTSINWNYQLGYLPISVHTFSIPSYTVEIRYSSMPRIVNNQNFALLYARVILTYTGTQQSGTRSITVTPPTQLTPINNNAKSVTNGLFNHNISVGKTVMLDYAVASENLTNSISNRNYLTPQEIQSNAGTVDSVEQSLKTFWDSELSRLAQISVPMQVKNSGHFNNLLKTSFLHAQLVRDGNDLKGGENGYDFVYDHDAHGILASTMELGGLTQQEALTLVRNLIAQGQHDYLDALGKLPWAIAKYAQKFNPTPEELHGLIFNTDFVGNGSYKTLQEWTHFLIENKIDPNDGLARLSSSQDAPLRSTTDNFAILLGLKSYQYLCEKANEPGEALWAAKKYKEIRPKLIAALYSLINTRPAGQKYLSTAPFAHTQDVHRDASLAQGFANGNAYAPFFFGRMYELFLFGDDLSELSPLIDNTLDYGLSTLTGNTNFFVNGVWNGNFGKYGNSFTTTGYNTSYTEGFLLGQGKYRSVFYQALDYLMDKQTGPYTWYESVGAPHDYGVQINGQQKAALAGHGSAPHIWSTMSQSRMLLLTLASEKYDGTLVLTRGLPADWLNLGPVGVRNYKLSNGMRFSYTLSKINNSGLYNLNIQGNPVGSIVVNIPLVNSSGHTEYREFHIAPKAGQSNYALRI